MKYPRWDSLESFLAHVDPNNPKMQEALNNWIPKYNHTIPFKGHVFGGWTEKVKEVSLNCSISKHPGLVLTDHGGGGRG